MKKLSLMMVALLVLVSSIVFCACNDGYKKLKIQSETAELNLVLDDEEFSSGEMLVTISGVKSWGKVSVYSEPAGLVRTSELIIRGKQLAFQVIALQPSGDGAYLVVKHLGSNKSLRVPLNIGQKLQTVESAGKKLISQLPQKLQEGEYKEIEIPNKQLLNCTPANYTDYIVWKIADDNEVAGVQVVSYDANNNVVDAVSETAVDENGKTTGKSSAVKSVIRITNEYKAGTSIVLNPVSVLGGGAVVYDNVDIIATAMNLLQQNEIKITSTTHNSSANELLKSLVLINNPDPKNSRNDVNKDGYDYYSTALIDFALEVSEGKYSKLIDVNEQYEELYNIELSSNIDGLLVENVDFGKIRAIATSTCVGTGEIVAKFKPNDCVGDVEGFSITIPCTVGERATLFGATREKVAIEVEQIDDRKFESNDVPLNDSNSLGQAFRFEVLSTNTLNALKKYKITIDKNMLYIAPTYIKLDEMPADWDSNYKNYYKKVANDYVKLNDAVAPEFSAGEYYTTSTIDERIKAKDGKSNYDLTTLESYDYQISILKDGRKITFYESEDGNYFISEALTATDTIYMKWVKTDGVQELGTTSLKISISNFYDEEYGYDIANNGFAKTSITYDLTFNRQRTVESINYQPVQLTKSAGVWTAQPAYDASADWQFYLTKEMFEEADTYYGIYISEVLGLNGTTLTSDELNNINLTFELSKVNMATNNDIKLGIAIFDDVNINFGNQVEYNYDSTGRDLKNIIIIGKVGELVNADLGDYEITITQDGASINGGSRDIKLYKKLTQDDITISLPNADFSGEYLAYAKLDSQPSDWNIQYASYYEYIGGNYVLNTSASWDASKTYYQKITLDLLDIANTYILATNKQYMVDVEIKNEDFVNISSQTSKEEIIGVDGKLTYTKTCFKDSQGNNIIRTGSVGLYNTEYNEKNYLKITYSFTPYEYDYYKLTDAKEGAPISKDIYVYIYEPLTSATFDHMMLYKYDIQDIDNPDLREQYGKETLNIILNSESVFNYVDIKWRTDVDGTTSFGGEPQCRVLENGRSAIYTFGNVLNTTTSNIVAILTQYGVQYPIYCGVVVSNPIETETITLNTPTNNFKSGGAFINLKVGESLTLDATQNSSKGEVSLKGFEYQICGTTGSAINSVVSVDANGILTAKNSGRAKLVIVAKDKLIKSLSSVTNYLRTHTYISNENCVLIVDIIVSDGSIDYPYLIADATSFRNIANDYVGGENTKHYALVADIDLNGQAMSFAGTFNGTITSYQDGTSTNRFKVYGVMLNESCPSLFDTIGTDATISDVDWYVDINYKATSNKTNDILIGLVGTNNGTLQDITINITGTINPSTHKGSYIVGGMVAQNNANVIIADNKLVGVQGGILVANGANDVYLGGVIGKNAGILVGAHNEATVGDDSKVSYDVYYDNQGATADIELQLNGVKDSDNSAIGGVIGYNSGTMSNVYALGTVLGVDNANQLAVDNVGGLIGKNNGESVAIGVTITPAVRDGKDAVGSVIFTGDNKYQITNSYSSAVVKGRNNVGGAVGFDSKGSYKKVYYEIYYKQESVVGNTNVGGLIGSAEHSSLLYCYANSFTWDYGNSVEVYDITGNTNVGGLIGLAKTDADNFEASTMNIVSSLASVSITATTEASGLVGRLNGYGAIYTAYYYGVINPSITTNGVTKMYENASATTSANNIPYNNVYAVGYGFTEINQVYELDTATEDADDIKLKDGVAGFNINSEYNNGKPYIVYILTDGETSIEQNLVTLIPSIIQINTAFTEGEGGLFNAEGQLYRPNTLGDYVKVGNNFVVYNAQEHGNIQRYSLIASLVDTESRTSTPSDYREKALVLYYYQFSDMSNENSLSDMYELNTVDMHNIVADDGIIVLPSTMKRFNLKSSNNNIVSVLSGGRLLLKSEGSAIITIISQLNPSVTASFEIIVRSAVQEFELYSSANIREEYNIEDTTISIVKGSSKIIYADYSSTIQMYGRKYAYNSPTNMQVEFTVEYDGTLEKNITEHISLNGVLISRFDIYGNKIPDEDDKTLVASCSYLINYGTPITISVEEYIEGQFNIEAKPYVTIDYVDNLGTTQQKQVPLSSYFNIIFKVATKQGATAINTDKTQLDMMPADEASNLDVKISTDIPQGTLNVQVMVLGNVYEVDNITTLDTLDTLKLVEMLDIKYNNSNISLTTSGDNNSIREGVISGLEGLYNDDTKLETIDLVLKLNENSHYVDVAFTLQVKLWLMNGDREIQTIFHINVNPQEITSVVPLNYRMNDGTSDVSLNNAYLSNVIRPGNTNIITVDIAPNIAVYDYVEIVDTTTQDKILFQQVKEDLSSMSDMDTWVDNGIKLQKYDYSTSKLYLLARLPLYSTANITHTIQITIYDKDDNVLRTEYLNLEAVMYPTVVLTYTYPNGAQVTADTRDDVNQKQTAYADLAKGVEAGFTITTYNIDDGTLQGSVTIKNGENEVTGLDNLVSLDYVYGEYILTFNSKQKDKWGDLVGKQVEVSFTASKSLNGITETCTATISFTIRHIVIHGVSMTHSTSNDELYGDWGIEFTTQFYFDKTDISYYNNGYWNIKYTLENTSARENDYIPAINDALVALNDLTNVELQVKEIDGTYKDAIGYNEDGISISKGASNIVIKAEQTYIEDEIVKNSNINNMSLRVKFPVSYTAQGLPVISGDGNYQQSEFGFNISPKSTPFIDYLEVWNQAEFEDMLEGKYYILMDNISLVDYVPLNTAIGALNGNGKTITIESFNESQLIQDYTSSGMYVGLFGTLAENTIVQNLKVMYNSIILNLDIPTIQEQHANSIYFGGVSAINLGVITNVKVSGAVTVKAQYITAEQIMLGGITAINGSSGSTKTATITSSTVDMQMSAMALIGGVAETNYGKITNTNFKGKITSNDTNEYASNIFTAGFVVSNKGNAYISLSYVQCGSAGNSRYNIHSVGRTAGFVFDNAGTINNAFVNQTAIGSQGDIAGFVYQTSGELNNCYAHATLGDSLFYQEFIYSTSDVGEINNCYVISDNTKNINVSGLTRIATSDKAKQEQYIGFIFAKTEFGIWSINEYGPTLKNSGFNDNSDDYDNIYNIYDVETYEGYFDKFEDTIENDVSFKIVRDIDFSDLDTDKNPVTFNKTLLANLEGNDMEISNYNIYKSGNIDSIGLFANIGTINENVYVRNLILKPASIKATGSTLVGALTGKIESSYVYNITIDSPDIMMLGKNAVGGLAGVIKGDFEVMGVTSNVSAFATFTYNTASQYNLYTGRNVTNSMVTDNITEVSYAGSIAGIVNGYNYSSFEAVKGESNSYYTISDITVNGDIVLLAETVGGAFGLVGERTLVDNLTYNLSAETVYQGVYVSGGLVGENRGIIQNSSIYAYGESGNSVSTSNCFDKYARVNGAIVGVNIGGLIYKCLSDIDVFSTVDLATTGGIVGRNIAGQVHGCTILGSVGGYYAGGIAGTDYSYETIIAQHNGHGTATDNTKRVYSNIKNTITYDIVADVEDKMYGENIITNKFLKSYVKGLSAYYSFNTECVKDDTKSLINTKAIYGLVVGLTDRTYSINVVGDKQLTITLTIDTSGENDRTKYQLQHGEAKYLIEPISNIIATNFGDFGTTFDGVNNMLLIYIIAYDKPNYEFWSPTTGYTDKYIAISDSALTEASGEVTE